MEQNPLMYAIIGDICGSIYERFSAKRITPPFDKSNLMKEGCRFTDDTVLTCAIAEAIMKDYNNPDFVLQIKRWVYKYPNAGFGGRFKKWVKGDADNNSFGNGAYMRISPILWAYDGTPFLKSALASSISATHDHLFSYCFIDSLIDSKEPIPTFNENQSKLIAGVIDINDYHKYYHFDSTSQGSVPEAIHVARTADNYTDCIKKAISLNGDTDTQAAIAGSIYGWIHKPNIPEPLYDWAWNLLSPEIKNTLNKFQYFLENRK